MRNILLVFLFFLIKNTTLHSQIVIEERSSDSIKSAKVKVKGGAFSMAASTTTALSEQFWGLEISGLGYYSEKLATGLIISAMAERDVVNNFPYRIREPRVFSYEIGWINQYDFVHTKNIRLGVSLNNGVSVYQLVDKAIQEEYWNDDTGDYETRSKRIASNVFYTVSPGVSASIRISKKFYITGLARYRFAIGNAKYGEQKNFSGYYFGLGFSVISFTRK